MSTPDRPARRTVPVVAAAGVLAVAALGVALTRGHADPPEPLAAPRPPGSPGVAGAGYVGSRWRLTTVTDHRGTTAIPQSIDAWLELAPDGELTASDDINPINGHFTITSAGFDAVETAIGAAGYTGNDPATLAALTGIHAVTVPPPSSSSGASESPAVHVTIRSADGKHLTLEAGGVRVTFVRSGPAAE